MNFKLSVVAFSTTLFSCVHASFIWKAPVSGDWTNSDNWLDGVLPSYMQGGNVCLTNISSSYSVGLSNVAEQVVWGLDINGSASGENRTALLVENSSLKVQGGTVIATNGEIRVGTSGILDIGGGSSAYIHSGSRFVVDGGVVLGENGLRQISVDCASPNADKLSSFVVNSGEVKLKYDKNYKAVSGVMLQCLNYGRLIMTGGMLSLDSATANDTTGLLNLSSKSDTGPTMELSGDSTLKILNGSATFGQGIATVKDNASVIFKGNDKNHCSLQPYYSDSNKKMEFNLCDNSSFDVEYAKFYLGKTDARTIGTRGTLNISGGNHRFGRYCELGCGHGIFTTTITGGHTEFVQYGLRIGAYPSNPANTDKSESKVYSCTGTVDVTGGVLYLNPGECHSNSARKGLWGTIIGYGIGSILNGWFDGRLNISGDGIVTNGPAPIVVGAGNSVGTITQSGGTFYAVAESVGNSPSYWNRSALVLGLCGGKGSYLMTGGTAEYHNAVYVGGIDFDTFSRSEAKAYVTHPANSVSSVGLLDVSGGSFKTSKSLFVGAFGTGTVHVSSSASLSVGRSLVLTNSVANAATLKLTLVGENAPSVDVADTLIVREGAKLEVDVTDYTGTEVWTKLVSCKSRVGSFAQSDIKIVGVEGVRGSVVFDRTSDATGSIWWYRPRGTAVVIR